MLDYSNIYGQVEPESKTSWIVRIVHNDRGHSALEDGTSEILWERKYTTSTAANIAMSKQLTYFLTRTPEYTNASEELDFE